MLKPEKALVAFFQKHVLKIGVLLALAASVIARYKMLPFFTGDMNSCLLPWTEIFRQEGLEALGEGVGNYNILYLMVLWAISQLTSDEYTTMVMIKSVSILFDYLLAMGMGMLVHELAHRRGSPRRMQWAWLAFVVTILLPQPMINSALWGQCDSIYAFFCVMSVYMLLRQRWTLSFVMLGLGICFKLQAIFLLPLFVIIYFVKKRFTLFLFAIPPALLWLFSIPAIVLGAKWTVAFDIYLGQTEEYPSIFINYPSIAALWRDERFEYFSTALVCLALLACFAMLGYILVKNLEIGSEGLIALAGWSVMACVMFLPSMHERYAFAGELLLWAWFLSFPSKKSFIPALVFTFTAWCAYSDFLFANLPLDWPILAILNLAALGWTSWNIVRGLPKAAKRTKRAEAPALAGVAGAAVDVPPHSPAGAGTGRFAVPEMHDAGGRPIPASRRSVMPGQSAEPQRPIAQGQPAAPERPVVSAQPATTATPRPAAQPTPLREPQRGATPPTFTRSERLSETARDTEHRTTYTYRAHQPKGENEE